MKARCRSVIGVALAAALCGALGGSLASAGAIGQDSSGGPTQIKADHFGVSVAVRDLEANDRGASSGPASPRVNPLAGRPGAGARGTGSADAPPDPLATGARRAGDRTPATSLVFDGTSFPTGCNCSPPDTTGDVGPNHYIQMVNATKVAIYNKAGTLLTPAFNLSTLFTSGDCSTSNDGDPQVLYDELADRWLLSQFTTSNQLCFAISQTSDPLGAYFTYSFTTPNFPDYFKVGVWPTGYYVGTNETDYTAYALDRTKMLAGDPTASMIRFPGQTNFLMPADVDGPTAPTPQGGLFYTFKDNTFHGGSDRLEVFQLTPDFATPASSTFSNIATIPITSFTYTVCGFFVLDCIPQPGTAEGLDPVSEWPMQRLAYRRFADHEALVGNFTVDVGSDRAGIRWFELRNTGAGYALFQEGTHAPADTLNRWMGSIAIDGDGNIALGYSVSSSAVFPSVRYATRAPSDPLGTLQTEQTMKAGAGSQTSTANRWGDYSAMTVDPANDCDFWYTNEYYSATAATSWKTSIGTFKVPTCPSSRLLTVATAGSGSGFVDSAPAGIDCGGAGHADCTESYTDGTPVTLTAHPDANTDFAGFSGDCTNAGLTCTTTMDAAKSVTATFTLKQRALSVVTAGTGSGSVDSAPAGIDCGHNPPGTHTDCNESYADGTVATLTAHPAANTDFAGFSGGGCTGTAPTCAVTMDAAKSVTATSTLKAVPSNEFTVGKVKLNKKKGTATISVTVPGPGELALGGKGVKPQRHARAVRRVATKPVSAAGPVSLKVKPTGKTRKKLKKKGKAKVRVTITFTPSGGTAAAQTTIVKLRKKR